MYRQLSCQGITILNLLSSLDYEHKLLKRHPRKEIGQSGWQTHKNKKWKRMIVSKIEKSCSFPMWFKRSVIITEQLILIYNTTEHKNKSYVALNVVKLLCHKLKTPTGHKGRSICIRKIVTTGIKPRPFTTWTLSFKMKSKKCHEIVIIYYSRLKYRLKINLSGKTDWFDICTIQGFSLTLTVALKQINVFVFKAVYLFF